MPDRTFATPDAVVRAYLAAARWEDRLPCVAEPKAVRQLMAVRYRDLDLASAAESGFLPGKLTVKPGTVGGRVIVDVDVHEFRTTGTWEVRGGEVPGPGTRWTGWRASNSAKRTPSGQR